jgi:phospholipid/cholesterol/gamma-HCH transport system substrate-binding protein
MIGKPESIDPYVAKLTHATTLLFDTLNKSLRDPDNEVGNSLRDVQATLQELRKTTTLLAQTMAASSSNLSSSLSDVAKITANLSANSDKINRIITSTGDLTTKAGTIDFAKINQTTEGVGESVDALKKTLAETQKSLAELTTTLKKVNGGEGTVGQLATNDSVYNSLNLTLVQIQGLMQDLRLNPKRYINLNPFRKYKTYMVPTQDPLMDTLQKRFNATKK